MSFKIESTHLNGVVVIAPDIFKDDRGFFTESYRADSFKELGLPSEYLQDNHSGSIKGVTRGLHFQWDPPMAKLMRVTVGTAFIVAVDIRKGSPTLGKWFGMVCSSEEKKLVFAPAGFARGFCAMSDYAEVQYKCTGIYNPRGESGILWNDPAIGIEWPVKNALLSGKDAKAQTLAQWLENPLSEKFRY